MSKKLFIFSCLTAIGAYFAFKCHGNCGPPALPEINENEWWGPGESVNLGEHILPFKIEVVDREMKDLKERLNNYLQRPTTPPLENQGFQYGFNTDYLKEFVTYWKDVYLPKWKSEREKFLDIYPHYKTHINGMHLHFMRARPKKAEGKKVLPLLLLHGWPGSIREFYDIIPRLAVGRDDFDFVFDVIVPSLPGYGFSKGPAKTGFGTAHIAVVFNKLMKRLGYEKYYVQGGDWGSVTARNLATIYPDNVQGIHLNFCFINTPQANLRWFLGSFFPSLIVEEKFQNRLYPMSKVFFNLLEETGYYHLQATKPDTIGTALSDTPAGLAAYILEKFSTWTNPSYKALPDGGLTKKFSLDALLDHVMIYWITNSITTSQRLYAETQTELHKTLDKIPTKVPTACARAENELIWQPESILKLKFQNLVQVTDIEGVGHFPAFEEPEKLSEDIWKAVKKFEEINNETAN